MKRIPELELMDDPEQAQAYAEADFSEPHEAFVQYFRDRFPDFESGEVADLGCGPADVTLRFARAYRQARIIGVDGARAMLAFARKAVTAAGMEARIRLVQCVLPSPALGAARFDLVLSNSLLHHLDDPHVLWQTVKQIARPGALLQVMDLKRPNSAADAQRLVRLHAQAAPAILRRDFYNSLRAAYRPEEIEAQLGSAGLSRLEVEVVSDRHVLVWGKLD
jgi:ubiquinone/menaquinone biosynthesis C-methylase UbiE